MADTLYKLGTALDLGTSYIIGARETVDGKVEYTKKRNAFFDLQDSKDTVEIINSLKVDMIKGKGRIYVLGDDALTLASAFRREARRPMNRGVLSNKDELASDMLREIVKSVLGPAKEKGEPCCFTLPAKPLGTGELYDPSYHEDNIKDELLTLGYEPIGVNEALCLAFAGLRDNRVTGISSSCGGGQSNVCYAVLGEATQVWSIPFGGDKIDEMAASRKAGLTASKITKIKEDQRNPIDLIKDNGSSDLIRNAIVKSYRRLIREIVANMEAQFADLQSDAPVPIIIGGGTSLIAGFLETFKEELKDIYLPFEVSEVKLTPNPLYDVALGAMLKAQLRVN